MGCTQVKGLCSRKDHDCNKCSFWLTETKDENGYIETMISGAGNVVLPRSIAKELDIRPGDMMLIKLYKDELILKKSDKHPLCDLCHKEKGSNNISNTHLCNHCLNRLKDLGFLTQLDKKNEGECIK